MTRDATTPIQRFEYSTCPRCSKRAYGSKAAARAAKKELNDRALHLYRCAQGNLHLGHMAPGATREVYRERAAARYGPAAAVDVGLGQAVKAAADWESASADFRRVADGSDVAEQIAALKDEVHGSVVLSARARRDVDHYRTMAAVARTAAASHRAQAAATQPTRDPADLERDAQAADLDATRWDALADELAALEPAGGPVGQEPML